MTDRWLNFARHWGAASFLALAAPLAAQAAPPPAPALTVVDAAPAAPAPVKNVVVPVGTPPLPQASALPPQDADPSTLELSLNSVVLFALDDNPDVKMAIEREKQAEANTGKARSKYYPLVDLVLEEGDQFNNPAGGVINGGHTNNAAREDITLKQVVYDFGQTNDAYDAQKQLQKSASLDTQANVENTLDDTIGYYLDILQYQQSLKDSTAFLERLKALVKTVSDMYEAGGTSKTTLDYANSRLAAAEQEINSLQSSLNDSVSNLEFLTGKLPTFVAKPPDDLDPTRLDLDQYVRMGEQDNTGLQLAGSDIEAQKQKLAAAKAAQYPTFNALLIGDETHDDGGEVGRVREGQAVLQLDYRIFDGHEQRHQIELNEAQITEAEISREKNVRDLRKKIKLSYDEIRSIEEAEKQTRAEIDSSEALQKLNRENFKLGSISIIELIEGEERLDAARTKLHSQESNLYNNTYHLLITAGMLKKDFFCHACSQTTEYTAQR